MKDMDRRGFMQNAAKTVISSLIGATTDLSSTEQEERRDESDQEVSGGVPDMTYIQRDGGIYVEVLNRDLEGQERFINMDADELERLEPEHPLRVISNLEYNTFDAVSQTLEEEYDPEVVQTHIEESQEMLQEVEGEAGSFDEAWTKLREDAEAASTEFDYIDSREHSTSGTFVEVPDADMPEQEPNMNPGVYFGEQFDAWQTQENRLNSGTYDTSVLMVFEPGSLPEDVLSEEEYFQGDDLSGDMKALKEIYGSSSESKEDYEFNFQ